MSLPSSFSLRLIETWLNERKVPYTYNNARNMVCTEPCNHGVGIPLFGDLWLSVQTHTTIAGGAFCEAALMRQHITTIPSLGCKGILRLPTPETLFHLIMVLAQKLAHFEDETETSIRLADGSVIECIQHAPAHEATPEEAVPVPEDVLEALPEATLEPAPEATSMPEATPVPEEPAPKPKRGRRTTKK